MSASTARICMTCSAFNPGERIKVCQETSDGGYRITGEKLTGQCRARPPVIDPEGYSHPTTGVWPTIEADEWCAAWSTRGGTE